MTVPLRTIALRKAQRGLLIGGTGSGKSTLAEFLIPEFAAMYRTSRILILDSKPRFRAEWEPTGQPAKRRYRNWDHGTPVADSIRLQNDTNPRDALNAAWKHGRIVIAQTEQARELAWTVAVLGEFIKQARTGRPQLVYVDETLDFFYSNAAARGGSDAILRVARAGRERGIALLAATQRPKGIPIQLKSEMSCLYLFRLEDKDDLKELGGFGYPWKEYPPPEQDHLFMYWDKTRNRRKPLPMTLGGVS